jgi:hypothetical protein
VIYWLFSRRRWWLFGARRCCYIGISSSLNHRMTQHLADKPWAPEVDWGALRVEVLGPEIVERHQAEELENRRIAAVCPAYNQVGNEGRTDWGAYRAAVARRRRARGESLVAVLDHALVSRVAWWVRAEVRWWRGAVARGVVVGVVSVVVWLSLVVHW